MLAVRICTLRKDQPLDDVCLTKRSSRNQGFVDSGRVAISFLLQQRLHDCQLPLRAGYDEWSSVQVIRHLRVSSLLKQESDDSLVATKTGLHKSGRTLVVFVPLCCLVWRGPHGEEPVDHFKRALTSGRHERQRSCGSRYVCPLGNEQFHDREMPRSSCQTQGRISNVVSRFQIRTLLDECLHDFEVPFLCCLHESSSAAIVGSFYCGPLLQ
mmetsp:Transcript_45970/g.98514  ORF Transcript_45970/g.98514 Transcript_45970/m.98514 type:complete len:212 (+) Transcript_45970:501-1136(+)